jgi:hypothetical protein
VFRNHVDPIHFLSLVTHLHALIGLPIPYIPMGLGLWLVELLSPAVISCRTSLPSYMMIESGLCLCESVWSAISRDVR